MKRLLPVLMGFVVLFLGIAPARADDDRIREMIIQQSIASYPGTCACPYSTMRNGRRCGGRSAYSKPGGFSPICYKRDIPDSMVMEFKRKLSGG